MLKKLIIIKSRAPSPCYILKQQFKGREYILGLGTKKTKNGEFTKVVMNDSSERSLKNAWRFVTENDRTFSCKYMIQNCETEEILSVSYKKSFKSDKVKNDNGYPDYPDNQSIMQVEVYVVDEIPEEFVQLWRVDEQNDNTILISDASKPSFYLGVTSNGKTINRDVVSAERFGTDSVKVNFTFEEF